VTAIAGFDWDEGNRGKCQRHGVSIEALEEVFRGEVSVFPDPAHSAGETRFKGIGRTGEGRHALVVFTLRERAGKMLIRPISARYMHRKEVEHYEREAAHAGQR